VKFAAFEALYEGKDKAPLVAMGILKNSGKKIGSKEELDFVFKIEIPKLLSLMTTGSNDGYVPGINDHLYGNAEKGIIPVNEKIERGKIARQALLDYKLARENNNMQQLSELKNKFTSTGFRDNYFKYFGYAYINAPEEVLPDVNTAFYSFHLMVMLGFLFILEFAVAVFLLFKDSLLKNRWFLWVLILSIPLPYLASELGWVVTEMGRQPWIIQDLMPVNIAVSNIGTGAVQTTFWLFAFLFTGLLIAEVSIMVKQIKIGPKH
jgi:cytochrome d ubiquinol oxidase subunit I